MKRTQIYLDDDLLKLIQSIATARRTTVSGLVRGALREKYLTHKPDREQILLAGIGAWGDRKDLGDSTGFVGRLRKGARAARLKRPAK